MSVETDVCEERRRARDRAVAALRCGDFIAYARATSDYRELDELATYGPRDGLVDPNPLTHEECWRIAKEARGEEPKSRTTALETERAEMGRRASRAAAEAMRFIDKNKNEPPFSSLWPGVSEIIMKHMCPREES